MALSMRAGSLTHGLAPRDSLILTADSILAELNATLPRVSWVSLRRVQTVAQDLTRRYPADFETWFLLGEARYHWGFEVGSTPREALQAFDRAIRLDSSFAPAYIHAVELAFWLDGPAAGHRYARQYLALAPTDASALGIRLADQLMSPGMDRQQADRLLREASPAALRDARSALSHAGDSTEWNVVIARALAAAPVGDAPWDSPAGRELGVGTSLLYRGHVREAVKILYRNPEALPIHLIEPALVATTLPDTADRTLRRVVASRRLVGRATSLPWWAARRDSAMVREIERISDSAMGAAPEEVDRNIAAFTSQAARAYLALVRHDTAGAVQRFEALPDSLCPMCYFPRMTLAHLLAARQDDARAAALLNRWPMDLTMPSEVLWTLERARVAERIGDREKAIRSYQYVANVWRHADPELQPYVAEAREGLGRMTSEPGQ
jgi:serine/threonine-protein kinase